MDIKKILGFSAGILMTLLLFTTVTLFPLVVALGLLNLFGASFYSTYDQLFFSFSYLIIGLLIDLIRENILGLLVKQGMLKSKLGIVGITTDFLCTLGLTLVLDYLLMGTTIGVIPAIIFAVIWTAFSSVLQDYITKKEADLLKNSNDA